MTRSTTFRAGLFLSLLTTACAHVPVIPPEPRIITQEVRVPVTVPCPALERLGPAPAYPDTDAALRGAPNLATRVGMLLAGRLLRIARESAVEAGLRACAG